jgi:3-oxoacyl-[acyl-carrier-protein] synthase II
MTDELWITGIGIISAAGNGYADHFNALQKGCSALSVHNFFDGDLPDPCICGKVPSSLINESIDATAGDRCVLLADKAISEALGTSKVNPYDYVTDLIAGTTLGNMHGGTLYYKAMKSGQPLDPDLVKNVMPDAAANVLSKKYGFTGRHITVSSACASGTTAIGTAMTRIRHGHSGCAVAGGVDALSPFVIAGFNCLRLLSKKQCRPFSVSRDGLNPGEGAAFCVIESKEHAQYRHASPVAKISGYGNALEAYHYTKSDPQGSGIASAIRKALDNANVRPDQIDHIHAHGTATVFNDITEYNGFVNVFGDRLKDIPVCSSKSMLGHTYGAAGAISAVFAVMSITNGIIPATLNCSDPDPLFTNLNISDKPRSGVVKRVLSVSLGFGGECAALVLEAL